MSITRKGNIEPSPGGSSFRLTAFSIVVGIAALLGLSIVMGSWYTINERERGILLRAGKLVSIESPGLGFKIPLLDSLVIISMETQLLSMKNLHTYSRDQQPAVINISINYRAVEGQLKELYQQFGSLKGYEDRILVPQVLDELKVVFGRFNAVTAIQERGRLNQEVRTAIVEGAKGPVIISNVQIENIDFSQAYEQSIEQRMLAEVEVQKIRQNAEREKVSAEIVSIKAKAEADRIEALAKAEAAQIRLRGNAEAEAIKARGAALADSPRLIELVQAERWNGVLPTTVLPSTTVPIVSMGSAARTN
jgi:regulator of protease activity HflC (stomatin/prohibitin superfamily)